jgi:hypothetical protein
MDVGTPLRSPDIGPTTRAAAPEKILEIELDVASSPTTSKDVSEVESSEAPGPPSRRLIGLGVEAVPKTHLTELVIQFALLGVGNDRVRSGDIFEAFLRLFVVGVAIGMELFGKLPVCLLELLRGCLARHAQDLVEITVSHSGPT